jgi:thioredoxin 1
VNEHVRELTDGNWDGEVLKSADTVLVDFWAPWCPPCRMIAPSIEALAEEFKGRAKVGKLNVDDNPEVAARYRITSIPTLLLFRGGQLVDQRVGAAPKPEIASLIERQIVAAGAGPVA